MESYYQNDMYAINRDKVLIREGEIFEKAKKKEGMGNTYLHLGCGSRILAGFINVDKYYEDSRVINYDIYKLPYDDNSVDMVYCSHVLEHLPIRHAKLAVKEWSRVLRTTGDLYLAIPDLEIILYKLLDPNISDQLREWLMYTLFGFQTNPNNRDNSILDYPVDLGQFHTCGFTKKTITTELETNNFEISSIYNYDGWGTPSTWVEAKLCVK